MTNVSATDLRNELAHCTGTETWYRHSLNRHMRYTEGVQLFAERAAGYWFLDIVGTEFFQLQKKSEFVLITLLVKGRKAIILVSDGNENKLRRNRNISFTDCPEGEWKFYLTNNTLLLPSEY
jgi:hypothetical protein